MKHFKVVLIGLFLGLLEACCPQNDYEQSFNQYAKAQAILTRNFSNFLKYEKEFNKSGDGDFIFLLGKDEFAKIAKLEADKDLNTVLRLWDDNLLENSKGSLWLMKNGNIYFQVNKCSDEIDYLVYDGGEEIMVDVQSDIRKKRVKPNWIYMRMMK